MEVGKFTYKDLCAENVKVSNGVIYLGMILLFMWGRLCYTGQIKEAVVK